MAESKRLTGVQWLVCIIAAIGFAFDIYELLMLPLIVRSALLELGGIAAGTPSEFARTHARRTGPYLKRLMTTT